MVQATPTQNSNTWDSNTLLAKAERYVEEMLELPRDDWRFALWSSLALGHRVTCPACGSKAIVTGEPISAPHKSIKDDLITETQQYLPSKFECIACGMKIAGLSHLSASGLGDAYKRTQAYDAAEYYAPDDETPEWEDDNNEPY